MHDMLKLFFFFFSVDFINFVHVKYKKKDATIILV